MAQWIRFDDKRPKKGTHVFAIGNNPDNSQWLWWGHYNTERKDGHPSNIPIFWCPMPPFPIMPKEPVMETLDGQENAAANRKTPEESGVVSKKSRKKQLEVS